MTILICMVYGAIDELHQIYIPGRYASVGDWIADVLGVLIFVSIHKIYMKQKNTYQLFSKRIQKTDSAESDGQM